MQYVVLGKTFKSEQKKSKKKKKKSKETDLKGQHSFILL